MLKFDLFSDILDIELMDDLILVSLAVELMLDGWLNTSMLLSLLCFDVICWFIGWFILVLFFGTTFLVKCLVFFLVPFWLLCVVCILIVFGV